VKLNVSAAPQRLSMRFRQVDGSTSHFSLQLLSRDRLDRPLGPGVSVLSWTVFVQVFGRWHDEAIHSLWRPASEKRQCTKSREYGTRQCSECYGDRMSVAISMGDAARAECLHNFRASA
jgi:hypothetical protein